MKVCCNSCYQDLKTKAEKLDRLEKWLDEVESFETKGFTGTLEKTLYGKLVGTCKIEKLSEVLQNGKN